MAGSLGWNPHLQWVAARVVDQITEAGRRPFNGVHLRMEKDAKDWATIMGGKGVSRGPGSGERGVESGEGGATCPRYVP